MLRSSGCAPWLFEKDGSDGRRADRNCGPRDRAGIFAPQLIAKYQRPFPGFDEKIVSADLKPRSRSHASSISRIKQGGPHKRDTDKLEMCNLQSLRNTASDVWADSAYRSTEIEEKLAESGLKSRIHRRAYRNRELSEAQKAANTTRSKVRARVEHVFGDQKNGMGAEIVNHRHRSRAVQDRND
jgi:hypothetical protein